MTGLSPPHSHSPPHLHIYNLLGLLVTQQVIINPLEGTGPLRLPWEEMTKSPHWTLCLEAGGAAGPGSPAGKAGGLLQGEGQLYRLFILLPLYSGPAKEGGCNPAFQSSRAMHSPGHLLCPLTGLAHTLPTSNKALSLGMFPVPICHCEKGNLVKEGHLSYAKYPSQSPRC